MEHTIHCRVSTYHWIDTNTVGPKAASPLFLAHAKHRGLESLFSQVHLAFTEEISKLALKDVLKQKGRWIIPMYVKRIWRRGPGIAGGNARGILRIAYYTQNADSNVCGFAKSSSHFEIWDVFYLIFFRTDFLLSLFRLCWRSEKQYNCFYPS